MQNPSYMHPTLTARLLATLGLFAPLAAVAQYASLPVVTVQGKAQPMSAWQAGAAAAQDEAQQALDLRAGGTALVRQGDYADGPALNLSNVMEFAPGVAANNRHGDETRFSIRGSGIQRGFLLRGIQVYQDGVPLNHADGAGDFQAIDPLATQYVEIWRGMSALEYGANALGGAVNFVTPTGRTTPPLALRLQAGSFGSRQAHAGFASAGERVDGYVGVTRTLLDGYRAQSGTAATRVQGNVGIKLTPDLQARLYLSHVDSKLQMPGSLSQAAMAADRRQAAPNYERLNAVNNYALNRAAIKLSWKPRAGIEWTSTVYASDRDRVHAMVFGVLENGFKDTGLDTRLTADLGAPGQLRRVVLGAATQRMHGDQHNYANNLGVAGAATGASTQTARHSVLYGEYTHGVSAQLALQVGAQLLRATRDFENRLAATGSYTKDFSGFSPKLGVLYTLDDSSRIHVSLGRSFEAPPFGELVVRSTSPLASAQKATTLEAGYRKRVGETVLDATVYRSQVKGELLALNDANGVALGTVNADRTVHQGIELGAVLPAGRDGRVRLNYVFNDFRFRGDAVYGDRRLAGIAPHLLNGEYRWQATPGLWIAPAVELRGGTTWIDHANTVATGGFALLHLGVGGSVTPQLGWSVQARNLTDRKYVASTAVQANVRGADGGYYFPGDGRALYVGLNWRIE